MTQMSKMTRGHTGMRKGISLVEMLIAIVLFGLIGTIGYLYYKNYYDTSFAAKQLRVYVVMDQAQQLANGIDLYNAKMGANPTTIQEIVDERILTAIPVKQPFITSSGWVLDSNSTTRQSAGGDVILTYDINGTVTSDADKLDYCNILNNTAYSDWSVQPALNPDTNQTDTNTSYTAGFALQTDNDFRDQFHCADNDGTATYTYQMVFIKSVAL